MNWNPLYPSNDEVDPLEEAAREAEWMDDMRRSEQEWRQQRGLVDEQNRDIDELF